MVSSNKVRLVQANLMLLQRLDGERRRLAMQEAADDEDDEEEDDDEEEAEDDDEDVHDSKELDLDRLLASGK